MRKARHHYRNYGDILDDENLWYMPFRDGCFKEDTRHTALLEVLCCIPEDDFQILRKTQLSWFLPSMKDLGMVMPFTSYIQDEDYAPYAKVVYLSPLLERYSPKIALAVISHELAHIILNHDVYVSMESYYKQEKEAWDLAQKWGFAHEVNKHQRMKKKQHTYEKKRAMKLMENRK